LVVRYGYLWRGEADARREHAAKDRPACIVAAAARRASGTAVVLLPITHARPRVGVAAVELPARVRAHLGLDATRSWIVASECNVDIWPTPDLAPIPGEPGRYHYGFLPPALFRIVRDLFVATVRQRRMAVVKRAE
jgi:hypothetical protein